MSLICQKLTKLCAENVYMNKGFLILSISTNITPRKPMPVSPLQVRELGAFVAHGNCDVMTGGFCRGYAII